MAVFESKLTATVFHLIPLISVDLVVKNVFLGSGPNRGQSPVERGDFWAAALIGMGM